VLVILAAYGLHRYYCGRLFQESRQVPGPPPAIAECPSYLQLPIYNEPLVIERLVIRCPLHYPRELLDIQVLDI